MPIFPSYYQRLLSCELYVDSFLFCILKCKTYKFCVVLNNGYSEKKVSKYMKNNEIEISVEFGSKKNEATVWTCDLTQKYIDINGKYRS